MAAFLPVAPMAPAVPVAPGVAAGLCQFCDYMRMSRKRPRQRGCCAGGSVHLRVGTGNIPVGVEVSGACGGTVLRRHHVPLAQGVFNSMPDGLALRMRRRMISTGLG